MGKLTDVVWVRRCDYRFSSMNALGNDQGIDGVIDAGFPKKVACCSGPRFVMVGDFHTLAVKEPIDEGVSRATARAFGDDPGGNENVLIQFARGRKKSSNLLRASSLTNNGATVEDKRGRHVPLTSTAG